MADSEDNSSSQLKINMVSGVACSEINVISMLIAYPIFLHFLGYEGYGIWLVLTTVLSFAQLADIGIGQAVIKLIASEYGKFFWRPLSATQPFLFCCSQGQI